MNLNFTKMHGIGNDFIVINCLESAFDLTADQIQSLSDRKTGVGFDQLLIIEPSSNPEADFNYRIFNADGSEVEQCGNGARCVTRFIHDNKLANSNPIKLNSLAGIMEANILEDGQVQVNMGEPVINNDPEFFTLSLGNPHCVFSVDDISTAPVEKRGSELNNHPSFPEGVNVGFMQITNRNRIKLRVFERGAGETQACGSGACAAVVAGVTQDKLDPQVTVTLPGGELLITWQGPGRPVLMTGPAVGVYEGKVSLSTL